MCSVLFDDIALLICLLSLVLASMMHAKNASETGPRHSDSDMDLEKTNPAFYINAEYRKVIDKFMVIFLQDSTQLELLREFMKLQKEMMIMLLSMLEGTVILISF